MMYNQISIDGWLTIVCMFCGSYNHILFESNGHAWECWNCRQRHWIDEEAKSDYIYSEGIDNEEAEFRLDYGDLTIKMLNGCFERDSSVEQ